MKKNKKLFNPDKDIEQLCHWLTNTTRSFDALVNNKGLFFKFSNRKNIKHLKEYRDLIAGKLSDNSKNDLRKLMIIGLIKWIHSSGTTITKESPPIILSSMFLSIVWPIVIAKKLPDNWIEPMSELSSPEFAQTLFDFRENVRSYHDPSSELVKLITGRHFGRSFKSIVDDLQDESRGGVYLLSIANCSNLSCPPISNGSSTILRWSVALAFMAASGVIGNKATNLFDETLKLIENYCKDCGFFDRVVDNISDEIASIFTDAIFSDT